MFKGKYKIVNEDLDNKMKIYYVCFKLKKKKKNIVVP